MAAGEAILSALNGIVSGINSGMKTRQERQDKEKELALKQREIDVREETAGTKSLLEAIAIQSLTGKREADAANATTKTGIERENTILDYNRRIGEKDKLITSLQGQLTDYQRRASSITDPNRQKPFLDAATTLETQIGQVQTERKDLKDRLDSLSKPQKGNPSPPIPGPPVKKRTSQEEKDLTQVVSSIQTASSPEDLKKLSIQFDAIQDFQQRQAIVGALAKKMKELKSSLSSAPAFKDRLR